MPSYTPSLPALALSLLPDPFYQSISVDQHSLDAKTAMLERYFEYSLDEAQRTGRCVTGYVPEHGATAWLLPRTGEIEAAESTAKHAFLRDLLGPKGFSNYQRILAFMSPLAQRDVPDEAWYLSIIGIHPSAQGRGLGQTLLEPTLREATAYGAPCYLETFTPRNQPFYERLGFRALRQYDEPTTKSSYVIMLRDAHARIHASAKVSNE